MPQTAASALPIRAQGHRRAARPARAHSGGEPARPVSHGSGDDAVRVPAAQRRGSAEPRADRGNARGRGRPWPGERRDELRRRRRAQPAHHDEERDRGAGRGRPGLHGQRRVGRVPHMAGLGRGELAWSCRPGRAVCAPSRRPPANATAKRSRVCST